MKPGTGAEVDVLFKARMIGMGEGRPRCIFWELSALAQNLPELPEPSDFPELPELPDSSEFKYEEPECIVDDTIRGLINTKMLSRADAKDIVDTHVMQRDYTYPIPSLERDKALAAIHPFLESKNIYSRGRFGAWRYEVGNMDHSVAQGVEWVNRIVKGETFDELTYMANRGC